MFYWFSYYVLKALGAIFSPRVVSGREHVPVNGSYILASNHMSNLDPFLIGLSLHRRLCYMTKDVLFKRRILRFCLNRVGAYPVRRGASDVRALRETLRRLNRGFPVVLFPEGTRGPSGTQKRSQSGIGFLAVKGNVPVVPVHIGGSEKVLPPGARFPKRCWVTITFGEPLIFTKDQPYDRIVSRIMNEINSLAHPA